MVSPISASMWYRRWDGLDPAKDWRDHLDFWTSPLLAPSLLVVISDDVPRAAAAPVAEGLRAVRRHPLQGSASSLVGGDSPGRLSAHIRSLKSVLLLILDPTVASLYPPMMMPYLLYLGDGEREGRSQQVHHISNGVAKLMPPPISPPPPTILCTDQCVDTPM